MVAGKMHFLVILPVLHCRTISSMVMVMLW